jgi:phosphohistidine phosphatase SixA
MTSFAHIMAQEAGFKGKLYIVRHAEKDTGTNPALSLQGKKEQETCIGSLKNKKIDLILVSQYRRTAMTADSLRLYNKIETLQYKADATAESLFQLIEANAAKAKNILIVGHSNTLPVIIKKAGVENYPLTDIPDYEYDNLFVVEKNKAGAKLVAKKFGTKSIPQAAPTQMKISQ